MSKRMSAETCVYRNPLQMFSPNPAAVIATNSSTITRKAARSAPRIATSISRWERSGMTSDNPVEQKLRTSTRVSRRQYGLR